MSGTQSSKLTRTLIWLWTATVLLFLYMPMLAVVLASFSKQRYFRFPITRYTTEWYGKTLESLSVRDLLWTSRVWPGAVLVDGEIAGIWRRSGAVVTVQPWQRLSRKARNAVEAEAASLPLPGIDGEISVRWER